VAVLTRKSHKGGGKKAQDWITLDHQSKMHSPQEPYKTEQGCGGRASTATCV